MITCGDTSALPTLTKAPPTWAAIVPGGLSPNESWNNGYVMFLLAIRRFTNRVV
jgi:hypothetical protein